MSYSRVERKSIVQTEGTNEFYDVTLTCSTYGLTTAIGGGDPGNFPHAATSRSFAVTADTINGGTSCGAGDVLRYGDLVVGTEYLVEATYTNASIGSYAQTVYFQFASTGCDSGITWLPAASPDYTSPGPNQIQLLPNTQAANATMTGSRLWTYTAGHDAAWVAAGSVDVYAGIGGAHSPSTPVVPGEHGTFRFTNTEAPSPGQWVLGEVPTPTPNGTTTTFTLAWPFADGSLKVTVDGLQVSLTNATLNGAAGTFDLGWAPDAGEAIRCDYQGR